MSKYKLPDLPYDFGALEPVISGKIMELHHSKHHQAYVNNLNASIEKFEEANAKGDVAAMVSAQSGIKFNGGGHVNHSIFWTNLCPEGEGGEPSGAFGEMLNKTFTSKEKFIEIFNGRAGPIQGSGWCWLCYCKESHSLRILTRPNQDPICTGDAVPLLGIDVWEHAYYLQYENRRPDYLKNIWRVVNWHNVAERFDAARK